MERKASGRGGCLSLSRPSRTGGGGAYPDEVVVSHLRLLLVLSVLGLLGSGLGIGLGLSEASSDQHLGSSVPSVHPTPASSSSSTTTSTLPVAEPPTPGSPGWPVSVYEPAVLSMGGALSQCPNPAGLESFSPEDESRAQAVATNYGNISLDADLHVSDPSWWSEVDQMWNLDRGQAVTNSYVVGSGTGLSGPSSLLVPYSCGQTIGGETYWVTVGPSPNPTCDACRSTFSFVDRNGQPLIYFIY